MTEETLASLLALTRLEMLDLSFASQMSATGIKSIGHFKRLTSLSLAGCLAVDDDTLLSLTGMPELRFLSLLFLEK